LSATSYVSTHGSSEPGESIRALPNNTTILTLHSVWGFLILGIEALKRNRASPYLVIYGQRTIPTWTAPLAMVVIAALFMPGSSMLGHLCGLAVGYVCTLSSFQPFPFPRSTQLIPHKVGMGYLNRLIPPDGVCRWIETKLKLKARVPYYVSIDQKAFGRGGVLPGTNSGVPLSTLSPPPTPASPAA
jgi:hypothetical protein